MSARTSATRYAKALLDVAGSDADAGRIERDLSAFLEAMDVHAELRHALLSPSVPAAGKRAVAAEVGERLGMAPEGIRLLQLLANRDRLGLTRDLLDVYRERLLARKKIVRAEIRSAVPLPPAAMQAIEARLTAVTGMKVAIDAAVQPDLIGGVLATVGSTVYDGTVKSQLQRLRKQLLAGG